MPNHDELLAKIDEEGKDYYANFVVIAALRAVVELCDKWETKGSYCLPIGSVIEVIEKELE